MGFELEPKDDGKSKISSTSTMVSIAIALCVVFLGCAAISTPKFAAARSRANSRSCYANQKTIVGAVEMYNLEQKDSSKLIKSGDLTSFEQALKKGGYLMSIPQDPGEGSDSTKNYSLTTEGNGIRCAVHGSIE